MTLASLRNNTYQKEIIFLFFLYFTLIISFILNENSTGGAIVDYVNHLI